MIEVHDVVWVLNAAVNAGTGFHLADKVPTLPIRAEVPVKILTFVALIVVASQILPAFFTVGVANASHTMSEIVFSDWLYLFTL